jgi:hypothetical protein
MSEKDTILAMEHAALDRWGNGDPSGFLGICAPDVSYFDNNLESRLDSFAALTSLYEQVRGKIHLDRYELLNPKVQLHDSVAVLTYNFVGYAQGKAHRWNCTEVYHRTGAGWRIIHTHWSVTQHSP